MTPQEVIEKFMAELNANSYSSSTSSVGTKMLDDAVKASSDFTNTQAVINQMLTDQAAAEREAIKYVLGDKYSSSYDGKQLSQISLPSMTWDEVKDKTAFNLGDTYGSYFYSRGNITLANIIKENAAKIFLEKYCGIQLNENYAIEPSSGYGIDGLKINGTFLSNKSLETPNSDTGAITGSDANLTLKVGEVIDGTTLTAAHLNALAKKYGSAAKLSGDTLVIGTGVEKTEYSVVPEAGNMYLFTAAGSAKNLNTGSNGWVVNATSGNDTITSGGRDSLNAGAGNDKIIANADEATITTGAGNDTVEISASVKSVTITDLNSYDTLTISGTFEIGSAKLENSMLVVTDKTGTRKIKFSDLTNVGNAKIGAQTISTWLSNSGYNLNNLASGDVAEFDSSEFDIASGDVSDAGRAAIDPNYKPAQIDDVANQDVAQTQTISSATNINLDNVSISSGTVTSGGTTVGTVSSVTPAVMNFTTKGLTIHVGNGTATSYNQLTSAQKMMVAALFKWWAKESLELNEESYGIGFESDTAKVTDITLSFENIGGNTLAQVGSYYRGDNISKLVLQINNNYYNSFTASDTDGISTVNGAGFLDRTLAHEFTHAVMATNINNFHNLPQFIREGMAELTHGIDDERGYEIFKLAYDSSSLSNALNLSNTSTGNTIAYSGGYMFLRYFAKQSALQSLDLTNLDISDTTPADTTPADTTPADTTPAATTPAATTPAGIFTEGNDTYNNTVDNVQLSALGGDDFISNSGDSVMIDGGKGDDEISNYKGSSVTIVTGDGDDEISNYKGSNVTINAGDGNDEISNYKGSNVMIDAGAGDDTFDSSGGSNLTIIGGKGDDAIKLSNSKNNLIEYTSGDGKDTVYGFDTSSTLKIGGGTGTYSTTKSGNDIIVSVGSGYILLKDAASLSAVNISGKGTTPADTTPADTTPADTTPADTTPADTTPADTTPADTTPADTTPADTTPADTTPADTTPADTTPGDTTPADTTPADTTPADTTPADTTPADTTPSGIFTEGNDIYTNTVDNVQLLALGGDDRIINNGASVTVYGMGGNDSIHNNHSGINSVIDGGAGDDYLHNNASKVSVSGGEGNDSIDITYYGEYTTIKGGKGDDQISITSYTHKDLIEYTSGDGKDTVYGFNASDTLQIGGGTGTYSTAKSGNDILVTVGDGFVLLKNAASLSAVNISGAGTTPADTTPADTTPADTTPAATIISGIFTEGNDTYNNTVDKVQLLALGGDDKITNSGANVYIDGMGGNDSIYNTGASVSIDLGAGNDFIITGDGTGSKTTVFGGEGNDSINNNFYGSNSVLDGGKGDDYLHNNASNVLVKGGEGNDSIDVKAYAVNTTISGGKGNDRISITSYTHRDLIEYTDGDGFDTVYGFNTTDTLQIGGGTGTYSTTKSGNDIVVSVGSGSVLLKNAAGLAPLNIAGTDKTPTTPAGVRINNYTKNTLIASGAGNDTIYNSAASVTVDSGAGDDSIYSHGYYVTINSGDGNDTIYNSPYSDRVTINAGAGDDYVQDGNFNTFTKISLGAGDDTFVNHWSDRLTLSGGTGNDSIKISAHSNENVFEYAAGDGDDTIYGFKPTDTLSLTGGAITGSLVSGDDLILNVGTGSIKFINTRSVNVNGTVFNPSPSNNGTSGHDFITNFDDGATINGYGDSDKIANAGDNVLINTGDGDNSIGNFGNNTTIVTGNGNNTILGGTYANASIVAGSGNDSIHNGWTSSTIDAGAGNDTIVNHYTSLIKGGAGDDVIRDGNDGTEEDGIGHPRSTLIGGTGNDTIYALAGWDSEELIEYTPGDGHDVVYGFSAKDTLVINDVGGKNTYSTQKSGNDILVTVGDGSILLKNVTSLSSANLVYETLSAQEKKTIRLTEGKDNYSNSLEGATILALGGDDSIYNSYSNVSIAGMGGNDSIYNRGSNVTIDGGAGNDSIRNNGSKVTISVGEGDDSIYNYSDSVTIDSGAGNDTIRNTGSNVTIDSGADNDFILSSGVNVTISGGKGNDSVNLYNAKDNVIGYTSGDGNDTIWHFGDDDTLKISGDTYSTAKSGNDILVTVGDGSILLKNAATLSAVNISSTDTTPADTTPADTTPADTTPAGIFTEGNDTYNNTVDNVQLSALGGDDSISNTGNNVTISGGKDNDQISLGSGAKNNVIEYTSGDGSDTVYGFNSDDTLKISGGDYSTAKSGDDVIVSIGGGTILLKDAATLSAVNISGVKDGTTSTSDEFYWTFNNGTATYVKKNGTATETLFTLSELNSSLTANTLDSVVKIDGTQITLMSGALGQKDVTLTTSGDYTLALDADCPTVTAVGKSWKLNGTTATYHDAGKSEGYALTNSKTVTYTAPVVGKTTLKVSGLVNGLEVVDGAIDGVELNGKVLTVKPEVVGENLSVTKGYKVIFDEGDYGGSTFTGTSAKDTIEVNGSSLEIDGGEGNDTITSKGDGGNIYLFAATGGKDVVVGYGDKDIIKITDDSDISVSVKGKDIIVTAGKGSMTLKDAAKGTRVNIVDANDKTLVDETFYADKIVDGNSVTLISAFKDKIYTAEDPITAVDGSVVSRKFSLTGGDADNTLIGGGGANFIDGGKGENILTGGKGNDTFVTGNGNDTITDYGIGTDKISIGADITDFSVKNGDIILNFGDDKSLTIQNGDGKKINFLQNGKTSTEIFTEDGKTNTKGTSITLAPSTEDYTATAKMLTIDGGLTDSVWIVGNTKANKIFGGDGNDTLNGGSGKDTLTGGAGSDIFVYESGKDTITDYVSGEDKISLGAAAISESLDSKGNVVLKFAGTNSLTISKGDETSVRTITFTGEDGDTTKTYYSEQIVGEDGSVTLQAKFQVNTFAATNDLPLVDASAITKKFTLTGGVEDNTLIGGKGANLLDGGDGNDLLIGGNGNDTFVYSSGDDTIGDYDVKESISLSSAIKDFDLSGDDVIIGFDEGSLTIKDAAGKSITLVETGGNTQVNVFEADGIFNSATNKATAVTLAADTSTFDAASYSKLVTIDGGIVSDAAEIVGNAKPNLIFAGNAGATINGGKGNDTLWGGSGSDTFIYDNKGGQDIVYGFGDEDALQINGNFTATVNNNSIAFKVGSQTDALTLQNYTATDFNINGDTYQVSGNTLAKK